VPPRAGAADGTLRRDVDPSDGAPLQSASPGVPESFKVLVKELQSLGLAVEVLNEDEERIEFREESSEDAGMPELGINLTGHELTE
jgi:hypothetical protein